MLYNPHNDSFGGASTAELICAVVRRVDATNSLHALLALMAECSTELPIRQQYRMAGSLRDLAQMIETRPSVRCFIELLDEFVPTDEGASR